MNRYLLVESGCIVCSRLARDIESVSAGWLSAQSLRDPQMQELLNQARPGWNWEPTLVEVQDTNVHVFTGTALRIKLIRGLGPRRAVRIAQLVGHAAASSRAEHGTGRRDFFKQGAAFLSGLVLLAGFKRFSLNPAEPNASQGTPQPTHLAPDDPIVDQLKQSYVGRTAEQRFGDLDWSHVYKVTNRSSQLAGYALVFAPIAGSQALRVLGVTDMDSTEETKTLVLQLTYPSQQEQVIEYSTIDNHYLFSRTTLWQNGHATTTTSTLPPKTGLVEEEPDISRNGLICFKDCMIVCTADLNAGTQDCANNCLNCALDYGGFGWPVFDGYCIQCGICATAMGVTCCRSCYDGCKNVQ